MYFPTNIFLFNSINVTIQECNGCNSSEFFFLFCNYTLHCIRLSKELVWKLFCIKIKFTIPQWMLSPFHNLRLSVTSIFLPCWTHKRFLKVVKWNRRAAGSLLDLTINKTLWQFGFEWSSPQSTSHTLDMFTNIECLTRGAPQNIWMLLYFLAWT